MVEKEIYEATKIQRQKRKLAMIRLSVSPFHIKKPQTLTSLSVPDCIHHGVSGDAIVRDLADACASGALPLFEELYLSGNPIGDIGMIEFYRSIANGSLRAIEDLYLPNNQIGDAGMVELSRSITIDPLAIPLENAIMPWSPILLSPSQRVVRSLSQRLVSAPIDPGM